MVQSNKNTDAKSSFFVLFAFFLRTLQANSNYFQIHPFKLLMGLLQVLLIRVKLNREVLIMKEDSTNPRSQEMATHNRM